MPPLPRPLRVKHVLAKRIVKKIMYFEVLVTPFEIYILKVRFLPLYELGCRLRPFFFSSKLSYSGHFGSNDGNI